MVVYSIFVIVIILLIIIFYDYVFRYKTIQCNDFGNKFSGKIFLTYDDGPSNNGEIIGDNLANYFELQKELKLLIPDLDINTTPTENLLAILKKENAKAIFFLQGRCIEDNCLIQNIFKKMNNQGHIIGNHAYSHQNLFELKPQEVIEELEKTHQIIKKYSGQIPVFFRPPMGFWKSSHYLKMQESNILKNYYLPLFWHDFADDVKKYDSTKLKEIENKVSGIIEKLKKQSGGMIIVMHDVWIYSSIFTLILLKELKKNNFKVADPQLLSDFAHAITDVYKRSTFLYYLKIRSYKLCGLFGFFKNDQC